MAFTLWIADIDKATWHHARYRTGSLRYRALWGWQLDGRPSYVWPQKDGDAGPPNEECCRICVAVARDGSASEAVPIT